MDTFWALLNQELAQRCLPRPQRADGNYWGIWLPLVLSPLLGSVLAMLALGDPSASTVPAILAVYVLYLMANAARLGARTSLSRTRATSSLIVAVVKAIGAGFPTAMEVLILAPLVAWVAQAPVSRCVGYLELVVWSCTLLGLNAAARESSGLQATFRAWLSLTIFLMVSAFCVWATMPGGATALAGDVARRFNPLWGLPLALSGRLQGEQQAALELILYSLLMGAVVADTVGRVQARATDPLALSPPRWPVSNRFSAAVLLECTAAALLSDTTPLSAWHPRLPLRTLAGVAMATVATVILTMSVTRVAWNDQEVSLLHRCEANEKSLAIALELYAADWQGHYPASLHQLCPRYLTVLPTCPAAGDCTYADTYQVSDDAHHYSFRCGGRHHLAAGAPPGYPGFDSELGLVDGVGGVHRHWDPQLWRCLRSRLYLSPAPMLVGGAPAGP